MYNSLKSCGMIKLLFLCLEVAQWEGFSLFSVPRNNRKKHDDITFY